MLSTSKHIKISKHIKKYKWLEKKIRKSKDQIVKWLLERTVERSRKRKG